MNRLYTLVASAGLALAPAASACPVCDSDTGQQVRASIFGDDFGRNLVAILAPFPVLAALAALVRAATPRPQERT